LAQDVPLTEGLADGSYVDSQAFELNRAVTWDLTEIDVKPENFDHSRCVIHHATATPIGVLTNAFQPCLRPFSFDVFGPVGKVCRLNIWIKGREVVVYFISRFEMAWVAESNNLTQGARKGDGG